MASRRDFIVNVGTVVAGSVLGLRPSLAQQSAPTLPSGIGINPDYDGPLPQLRSGKSLGDRPPLNSEERIAKAIITRAPFGPTPLDVGKFFLAVGKGEYGKLWQPYAQGWPVRWNPVIVNFFQATKTTPEGDLTAWCAAFVNWCFLRSGKGFATRSASSASFRTFGVEISTPSAGDLVVFQRTGTESSGDMRGHVGFFVAAGEDEIEVLGGNQIEGTENSHMVSSKRLKKDGTKLTFHSYRTDPRLHN